MYCLKSSHIPFSHLRGKWDLQYTAGSVILHYNITVLTALYDAAGRILPSPKKKSSNCSELSELINVFVVLMISFLRQRS